MLYEKESKTMNETSKTEINWEENWTIELTIFDPTITEYWNMTGDWLSKLLFSLLKSNSDALLFKSIKDYAIPNESNLTVFGITNSVFLESLIPMAFKG